MQKGCSPGLASAGRGNSLREVQGMKEGSLSAASATAAADSLGLPVRRGGACSSKHAKTCRKTFCTCWVRTQHASRRTVPVVATGRPPGRPGASVPPPKRHGYQNVQPSGQYSCLRQMHDALRLNLGFATACLCRPPSLPPSLLVTRTLWKDVRNPRVPGCTGQKSSGGWCLFSQRLVGRRTMR